MKNYSIAIIGFGSTGQRILKRIIESMDAGSLKCDKITLVDVRTDHIDDMLLRTIIASARCERNLPPEVKIETSNTVPKNHDLYWIAIPCKRNVHDCPVDVKPLNKLVTSLQHAIHDHSIIFNSTMVPVGRNLKLYKKLTVGVCGNTSWFYVPITHGPISSIGAMKISVRIKPILKEVERAFDLCANDIEVLELATLAYHTREDLLKQHMNEVNTIAHARGLDVDKLQVAMRVFGNPKANAAGADVSTIGTLAAHMMVDKHDVPFSYLSDRYKLTPMLNGMLASGKYREDYIVSQIIHIANDLKPNGMNQALLFLHGSSEQANAIAYRLQKSRELPDYIVLYQVPYGGVAGAPEIMKMSAHESRKHLSLTHVRICSTAITDGIKYAQQFI